MDTQSVRLVAITFSEIGAVYGGRLELNKQKKTTVSLGAEVLAGSSV